MDAGDVYFAAPAISQLLMGESTIDVYNMMGYDLAAFGNHEFDKGQDELAARVASRTSPGWEPTSSWKGRTGTSRRGRRLMNSWS